MKLRQNKPITLMDAAKRHRENPKTFLRPSAGELDQLGPKDFVKIGLEFDSRHYGYLTHAERFWVRIKQRQGNTFSGEVANILSPDSGYAAGDTIEFYKDNIMDLRRHHAAEFVESENQNMGFIPSEANPFYHR